MLSFKDNKKRFFLLMVLFFLVVCGCHSAKEFRDGHIISPEKFRDVYIIGAAAGYALSVGDFQDNPELLKSLPDWSKVNFKDEMKLRIAENKNIEKEYDDYVKTAEKCKE